MPATMTTNAPVGPPICTRLPPSSEIRNPATMAVYNPCAGETPDAMPNAIASGSATTPTTRPAIKSLENFCQEYSLKHVIDLGKNMALPATSFPEVNRDYRPLWRGRLP